MIENLWPIDNNLHPGLVNFSFNGKSEIDVTSIPVITKKDIFQVFENLQSKISLNLQKVVKDRLSFAFSLEIARRH